MSFAIWKFPIAVTDEVVVDMPKGAKILSAADQNSMLCLWALVDVNAAPVKRRIRIIGTGQPANAVLFGSFVATVLLYNQSFNQSLVLHLFDLGEESTP